MTQDRQEILRLLKYGRGEEVRALVEERKRQNYPNEFVPFMDQMIREHKVSRKNVAVRSGLSQDYVYKLLRGDKHTDERDYILAMCFAIGMNLAQTQHALSSYGMPLLSEGDIRSHIIILAIEDGAGIDELNQMLEKANYPLLKTSPDMPSAAISSTAPSPKSIEPGPARKSREFEEIDSFTEGHRNDGNAPFDYDYQGWIKVRDEEGNVYQVEAVYQSEACSFIVFTEEQRKAAEQLMELRAQKEKEFYEAHKDMLDRLENAGIPDKPNQEMLDYFDAFLEMNSSIPVADMLERYETLEEAAQSEFFPLFLELEKRTDKKVLEVMKKLDDTREYGMRVGNAWHGKEGPKIYIEAFNDEQPERREYYQIVEYQDGKTRYTCTHESCFMQLEMGQDLYEVYFGEKREPEYFIDTDKNEFKGEQFRYRVIFNRLKMIMHDYVMKNGGFFQLDMNRIREEKVELLVEEGVQQNLMNHEEEAVRFFKEAIQVLESLGAPKRKLPSYLCTCFKIAMTLDHMGNPEAQDWWNRMVSLKDKALKLEGKDLGIAASCIVEAVMRDYRKSRWNDSDEEQAKKDIEEALYLIEHYQAASDDWITQFEARSGHAFMIEEDDLEESLREYRRALTIARNHHLDQVPQCADAVSVVYNNYAWVLWNKCGSEEAILHYGRAIDLQESYLFSGIVKRETVLKQLKHMGSALNNIYVATSRPSESKRLKERLAENGVTLDEPER